VKSSDNWRNTIIHPNSKIRDAILRLNSAGLKICLVEDDDGRLMGTLSDGDIRRGLLRGLKIDDPLRDIIRSNCLVVTAEITNDAVLQLMTVNKIQQIPIVDELHRLIGLHLWDDITQPIGRGNRFVIMAGGRGQRMMPNTEGCPKPMLEIAGKPMLLHIIERAKSQGFSNFIISVHYLREIIQNYFMDGKKFGVNISYLEEEMPLGTAGALSYLPDFGDGMPIVISNGDVITDINYGELIDFHSRQSAAGTMAVRGYEWQHPFGVITTSGVDIVSFEEKPISYTYINGGIYALDPLALALLIKREHCDMPELFQRIQKANKRIVAYPMHESWIDVGRPDDLKKINSGFN
jgi:dTDP-glucose pyrophosphorylase